VQPSDFNGLWDYNHPDESEKRFRRLFAADPGYDDVHLQLLTQIARAQGLQGNFEGAQRTLDLAQTHLDAQTVTAAARYALERGRAFNSAGDRDQARGLFQQAFEQAQAAGLDGLRGRRGAHAGNCRHAAGVGSVEPQGADTCRSIERRVSAALVWLAL
jgi:tetratricopeptide (TPR) repeat protein